MSTFATRLKAARLARGLTQEDLADRLSVTKSAVSAYELGAATPTFDRLPHLRVALETSLDELICGDQTAARMARQYSAIAEGRPDYEPRSNEPVTRDELRLLRRYRSISDKRRRGLLALLSE